MAGSGKDARDHTHNGCFELGVFEHDVGRLTTQLERDLLQVLGGTLIDALTGCVRTGERDLHDVGVVDHCLAAFMTKASDHVDHAGRETSLFEQLHERNRRGRGELGRLDDCRVASRERGGEFPGEQQQRRVPRCDHADNAKWFVLGVVEHAGSVEGNDRTLDLVGEAAVVAIPLGGELGLGRHLCDQLAVVAHLHLTEFLGVALDELGELVEQLAPSRCRGCFPTLEGF